MSQEEYPKKAAPSYGRFEAENSSSNQLNVILSWMASIRIGRKVLGPIWGRNSYTLKLQPQICRSLRPILMDRKAVSRNWPTTMLRAVPDIKNETGSTLHWYFCNVHMWPLGGLFHLVPSPILVNGLHYMLLHLKGAQKWSNCMHIVRGADSNSATPPWENQGYL